MLVAFDQHSADFGLDHLEYDLTPIEFLLGQSRIRPNQLFQLVKALVAYVEEGRFPDIVDLAANVMDWERIRHVPVENDDGQLVVPVGPGVFVVVYVAPAPGPVILIIDTVDGGTDGVSYDIEVSIDCSDSTDLDGDGVGAGGPDRLWLHRLQR